MNRRNDRQRGRVAAGQKNDVKLPPLSFRDVLPGTIGVSFYTFSWTCLTLMPLFLIAIGLHLILGLHHPLTITLQIMGLFGFGCLLVGMVLRWLARGIIEVRRARTFVAAALCALLGWGVMAEVRIMKPTVSSMAGQLIIMDQRVQWRTAGIVLIVTAIFLFWMIISRRSSR
jgi:hypothetical protein